MLFTAIIAFLSTSIISLHANALTAALSIEEYLSQVEGKNQEISAAKSSSEGASLSAKEATLTYSPNLFLETQWVNDHFRNALFPSAYQSLSTDTYTAGVKQKTPWGLSGALSYDLNRIAYANALDQTTGQLTTRRFYEGTPKLELSLSLWRNLFGGETQAQVEVTRAAAVATQYAQSFQAKATRAEAEGTYVRLVSAQQLIAVYQDSITHAQEMLKFSTRQMQLNLGENGDYLQAQANNEVQRLNLQSALDEKRMAAREFNRLRNIDSDEVAEALTLPNLKEIKIPERSGIRDDVKAAQEQAKLAASQAKLGAERNRPNLELYGSYALNAREGEFSNTFDHSFKSGAETSVIGLRFSMPLMFGTRSDVVRGFSLQQDAAEKLVSQKEFDEKVEWEGLVQQFDEAKKRYEIADLLSKIQKKKVENERLRLKRGRTTTYQTLTFTQDYNSAEAARIQTQSNLFNIVAKMKMYQGSVQ